MNIDDYPENNESYKGISKFIYNLISAENPSWRVYFKTLIQNDIARRITINDSVKISLYVYLREFETTDKKIYEYTTTILQNQRNVLINKINHNSVEMECPICAESRLCIKLNCFAQHYCCLDCYQPIFNRQVCPECRMNISTMYA
jgi:hypothetical protein